ncbi:hypothetical protein Vadar_004335 [Vaccinium darrowii]|uniref:Uncharacterized protein n=1 Tax=Vaccinium darrowii TaxID=229202 RepID=A0ACB7XY49_9ERIC|nr:hypothetical protein Vadar_004335 [Vaccinium darrowii]
MRLINDQILSLVFTDLMWALALPKGADREHKYCNSLICGTHDGKIRRLPKCLIRGWGGDPPIDRQKALAEMLEARAWVPWCRDEPHTGSSLV